MTTTLYNIVRSELIKAGHNEFVDAQGNLIFFDDESQFLSKIHAYDSDVSTIVTKLFGGQKLADPFTDVAFKMGFINRFANRRINRQTVEAFKMELISTFLTNKRYINSIYSDLEKYMQQQSTTDQTNSSRNEQSADSTNTTDNRSAFANLPQNNVQLDVDNTIMTTASDNTVSRNKQQNSQDSLDVSEGSNSSESKAYRLEELMKSVGLEERIYDEFDRKCFMQTW